MATPSSFSSKEWELAYRVALRVLKTPDRAEDAAQDALLRAFAARDEFRGDQGASWASWIRRIAFTTALGHLRKAGARLRHTPVNDQVDVGSQVATAAESPLDVAAAAQLAGELEGCLCKLRRRDRIAFEERFLRGTSERELGELLGVSTNAAKQRAFRARRAIRRCVSAKRPIS